MEPSADKNQSRPVVFVGLNGYDLPYTRVRCYHFAKALQELGMITEVLTYRDHLTSQRTGKLLELPDRDKISLIAKAIWRLMKLHPRILYVQKAHYHTAAPYLLYRWFNQPYILDYDDWDFDRSPFFYRKWLNDLIFKHQENLEVSHKLIRDAKAVIVSSHFLKEYIEKLNPKTYLVETGVDTVRFSRKVEIPKDTPPTFVWCGDVWGEIIYQNVLFLLECFAEVNQRNPTAIFKIAGTGEMMSRVKEIVQTRFSRYNIKISDWIDPDRIPEFLAESNIGLLPLLSDSTNTDWIKGKSPTKFFEYMAMGLASVSTRIGEIEYIVEDGIDGFLASNKEEFIDKMDRLAKNAELRSQMGKKAREKVEHSYSLNVLVERLYRIIEEIITVWQTVNYQYY
jgi:glycosyltransferase involved in cell wall biosynthesis